MKLGIVQPASLQCTGRNTGTWLCWLNRPSKEALLEITIMIMSAIHRNLKKLYNFHTKPEASSKGDWLSFLNDKVNLEVTSKHVRDSDQDYFSSVKSI